MNDIARLMNGRPRKTLNWKTPEEAVNPAVPGGLHSAIAYIPPAEAEANYCRQLANLKATETA